MGAPGDALEGAAAALVLVPALLLAAATPSCAATAAMPLPLSLLLVLVAAACVPETSVLLRVVLSIGWCAKLPLLPLLLLLAIGASEMLDDPGSLPSP